MLRKSSGSYPWETRIVIALMDGASVDTRQPGGREIGYSGVRRRAVSSCDQAGAPAHTDPEIHGLSAGALSARQGRS